MSISTSIEQDLKTALLQGDKTTVETLRSLKNAMLYAQVAKSTRGVELTDPELVSIFAKEAKKRQESADLYSQANQPERAQQELKEKQIIEHYLPNPLSESEVSSIMEKVINNLDQSQQANLGLIIGKVKQETKGAADGETIARLVKQRLQA